MLFCLLILLSLSKSLKKPFTIWLQCLLKYVNKIKLSSPKDFRPTENRRGIYFIPCSSCNLSYIGQRRWLKAKLDEHRPKVGNWTLHYDNARPHVISNILVNAILKSCYIPVIVQILNHVISGCFRR